MRKKTTKKKATKKKAVKKKATKKKATKKKAEEKKKGNYDFVGSKNNNAKLTEAQVKKMRALHSSGFSIPILSIRFKRPKNTVRNIVYGQTWKHLL